MLNLYSTHRISFINFHVGRQHISRQQPGQRQPVFFQHTKRSLDPLIYATAQPFWSAFMREPFMPAAGGIAEFCAVFEPHPRLPILSHWLQLQGNLCKIAHSASGFFNHPRVCLLSTAFPRLYCTAEECKCNLSSKPILSSMKPRTRAISSFIS